MSARRAAFVGLGLLAPWALLAGAGCERGDAGAADACECASEGRVVDATLLAFLSKARAAHHQADVLLAVDEPELRPAIAALERVTRGPTPATAPEVTEILADTLARLADLRSQAGDYDAAHADVSAGLERAAEPTLFRGRLLEVQGLVEERRAAALRTAGDVPGAERARKAAVAAFEEAVAVQDRVIADALGARGAP